MNDERVRGALREDHGNLLNGASSELKRLLIKSSSPWFVEEYEDSKIREQHQFDSSIISCQFLCRCPEWESPSSTTHQPGDCSTLLEGQEEAGLEGEEEREQDFIHTRGKLPVLWSWRGVLLEGTSVVLQKCPYTSFATSTFQNQNVHKRFSLELQLQCFGSVLLPLSLGALVVVIFCKKAPTKTRSASSFSRLCSIASIRQK